MPLPLEGLQVLDLAQLGPGQYATMILGDFGAEVLRVEPLKAGGSRSGNDREMERMMRTAYEAQNRNKRSIRLNLRTESGREVFYKLAKLTDILVEGFRPGVVKRLGIDYAKIRAFNPGIIYCAMSGYGQSGPYAALPGHDINYIALAGLLSLIGSGEGPPVIPMNFLADVAGAAHHAVMGILLALMARNRDNLGQYVDIAYLDASLGLMTPIAYDVWNYQTNYAAGKNLLNGGSPNYNLYRTKDNGYISIGCLEPHFWEKLCQFLGRPAYIDYAGQEDPRTEEIFAFLREVFSTRTREEWFKLLKDQDIPAAPVLSINEVFRDPQVIHRGMLVESDSRLKGKLKQVTTPIKLSRTPGSLRTCSPIPGEHTRSILQQIGYTDEQIRTLEDRGAVSLKTD